VVDKNIKTVLLLGVERPKWGLFTRLSELFPLFRILKTKCDMVSPHYRLIRFGYIWRLKLWKKPVLIWTVNDSKLMEKLLIDKKAAGIITNFPDAAIEILAKNKKV
ncbi:MAG: glycerophosphodiester phosphodiesterase, partial [Bacilli bacterium]